MKILSLFVGSGLGIVLLVFLCRSVFKAICTGVANAAGTLHHRTSNPKMFWITIFVQIIWIILILSIFIELGYTLGHI